MTSSRLSDLAERIRLALDEARMLDVHDGDKVDALIERILREVLEDES